MIRNRDIIFLLAPAILVAIFAFITIYTQYEPIYESQVLDPTKQSDMLDFVPIYSQDPIIGDKKAAKTIIAFEDMGCLRCQEQMKILQQIIDEDPTKLKIIWKSLDVTQFPHSSETAHSYAFCANKQGKFSDFEKEVYDSGNIDRNSILAHASNAKLNNELLETCLSSSELTQHKAKNKQLAETLNINTVPTIFINNEIIQEPVTLEGWKALLSL